MVFVVLLSNHQIVTFDGHVQVQHETDILAEKRLELKFADPLTVEKKEQEVSRLSDRQRVRGVPHIDVGGRRPGKQFLPFAIDKFFLFIEPIASH